MTEPHRIAVATFGRSDFSILRPLCRLLAVDQRFDAGLWVGGAHFEQASGRTIRDVEASGIAIWCEIDGGAYDRSNEGTVRIMAEQMTGFARAVTAASGPPDLVIILGDRFEAIAAGLAMVPFGTPVGHISGGSITEGAMDDVFRHCLTKIAAVHFCDLPEFARRIQQMGEPPDRIFTTGALGLDAFRLAPRHDFEEFAAQFGLDGLRPGYAIATVHPESRAPEMTAPMTRAVVEALRSTGQQTVFTYPNADPGSDRVIEIIEAAADGCDIHCLRGFGADWFPSAMEHAGLMVGNSSGGIIEAASFELPVVDVGDRQRGRAHGANVIHSEPDRDSIERAIATATGPDFAARAKQPNIYGDGYGAERVVAALGSLDWDALRRPKPFAPFDPRFVGELTPI